MEYNEKEAKQQFSNAQVGDEVQYMGFRYTVKEATPVVLVLTDSDGKGEFKVNLSMFLQKHGRVLKESETSEYKVPDSPIMPQPGDTGFALVKKNFKKYIWKGKFVKTFEAFNESNKFGNFEVGDEVLFNNKKVTIVDKIKGNKTNVPNKQGGITTGYKSNPCLYKLSNGLEVRGNKLKKSSK